MCGQRKQKFNDYRDKETSTYPRVSDQVRNRALKSLPFGEKHRDPNPSGKFGTCPLLPSETVLQGRSARKMEKELVDVHLSLRDLDWNLRLNTGALNLDVILTGMSVSIILLQSSSNIIR